MKKMLLLGLIFFGNFAFSDSEPISQAMDCKKAFGNPIFDELILTFTTEASDDVNRKVSIKVDYQHSGLDKNYYTKPITAEVTFEEAISGDFQIDFSDEQFGTQSYSAGTIVFDHHDDNYDAIATIDYSSEEKDHFGVLTCTGLPGLNL